MGFICPDCKVIFKNPEHLASHYEKTHNPNVVPDTTARRPMIDRVPTTTASAHPSPALRPHAGLDQSNKGDIHEEFLRALGPQLAELKEASFALGNALDSQNQQLGRLEDKMDCVQDGMKRVSVQAKRLSGRKMVLTFRFRCAFQEVETRKFLRDIDGEPVLG